VAGLAGRTRGQVVGGQADDAEVGRRDGERRRRGAMALGAVAAGAGRVGVDRGDAGHHRESLPVWQACTARWPRTGCDWPLVDRRESGRIAVAQRTVAAAGWPASATLKVPAAARGRVWKPLYWPATACWARSGTPPCHPHIAGLVAGCAARVTPLWICTPVGVGVAKPVPGAVLVAEAAMKPAGRLPRWQSRSWSTTGCASCFPPAPSAHADDRSDAGKRRRRAGGHVAGRAVVADARWFISEPLNLAPSDTGRLAMLEPAPTWQASHEALVGCGCPAARRS